MSYVRDEIRERAELYARYYELTKSLPDFIAGLKRKMHDFDEIEATIAWESIDQYEGNINPR